MSQPQICVTVTGQTIEAIRQARVAAEAHADLVELRLDTMDQPDPEGALAGRRRPAVVTCRSRGQGGQFRGCEDDRRAILGRALALGAEFIDVEYGAGFDRLIRSRDGRGVVVSRHDFSGLPFDVKDALATLRAAGAEIVKLAVTTRRLQDLVPLLDAVRPGEPTVLIGMGPSGVASRILAARFHSHWTYAGQCAAPGQMPVERLLTEFRFRRIRDDSALFGVVGRPVLHSLSPSMHNAGFAALGLNAAYVPLEAESVGDFRRFAEAIGLRGASVTAPFKVAIRGILDEITPVAQDIGAVNTVTIRGGKWIGTNTDIDGFIEPLRRRQMNMRGARALVLGAGGAAAAVALGLVRGGAHLTIAARRDDQASALAERFAAEVEPWPPTAGAWDLVVNATPAGGRAASGSPLPEPPKAGVLYDLTYDPPETELMRAAAACGSDVIGGLEMLVAQAERQFEIWIGQRPPADLFARAAMRGLELHS